MEGGAAAPPSFSIIDRQGTMLMKRTPRACLAVILGALALGACGDGDDAPAPPAEPRLEELQQQLSASDTAQRRAAVQQMGEIADTQPLAAEMLVNLLSDQDPAVAGEAQSALRRAGPAVLPQLTEALGHALPSVRTGALMVLARMGAAAGEAADEAAALLREDPDWSVRYRAAEALGAMGSAASGQAEALRSAAEGDEDANVRRAAEQALERVTAQPADTASADTTG